MVREIDFRAHEKLIEDMRRKSYGTSITHVLDEFDEQAHHFALYDRRDNVIGITRLLRSDEVERFEMMHESQLRDLVLPPARLSLELSRLCTTKGSAGLHLLKLCFGINDYARENGADYVVTKTGKHLLPLYERVGFKTFAPPFVSDFFEDKRPIYPIIYRWNKDIQAQSDEEVLVW